MPEYRLTRQAEPDLLDVFLYGLETFGHLQAQTYAASMEDCLQLLAQNPRIGRLAPSLGPEVRRHQPVSHVILYEKVAFGVLVLAILHKRALLRVKP